MGHAYRFRSEPPSAHLLSRSINKLHFSTRQSSSCLFWDPNPLFPRIPRLLYHFRMREVRVHKVTQCIYVDCQENVTSWGGHIYTNPLLCASAPWKQQQVNRFTEFIELNKQVILQLAQLTSCALSGNRKFTFVTWLYYFIIWGIINKWIRDLFVSIHICGIICWISGTFNCLQIF